MLEVLLVEDNAGDIILVQKALQEYGIAHHLRIVRDGAEALEFVSRMGRPGEAPCPDLILLDLNLPKVDGPEILSEFRKHPECMRTPVIVVTSSDTLKERSRMTELGIARYFRKPSDLDEFLQLGAIVREVVDHSLT